MKEDSQWQEKIDKIEKKKKKDGYEMGKEKEEIEASILPMAINKLSNSINSNSEPKDTEPKKEWFFKRAWNYIKSIEWNPWKIEEEEYIDAHGFKAKRPKKKIPLRNGVNKAAQSKRDVNYEIFQEMTRKAGVGNFFY